MSPPPPPALNRVKHGDPTADQIVRDPSRLVSRRSYQAQRPNSGYYRVFYKAFLLIILDFGGFLESQNSRLCFGAKSFVIGQKLAKLRKEDRWSQPVPTVGPIQNSVPRDFQFFLARDQIFFYVDSATVRREKKKRKKEKRYCGQREEFFRFFAGSLPLGRRISTILCTWCERISHAVDVTVHVWSGLLVRDWTDYWS